MSPCNHQYTHTCGYILSGMVTRFDLTTVKKDKRDNLREQSLAKGMEGFSLVRYRGKKKRRFATFTAGLSVVPDPKNLELLRLALPSVSSADRRVQDWLPASAEPVADQLEEESQVHLLLLLG